MLSASLEWSFVPSASPTPKPTRKHSAATRQTSANTRTAVTLNALPMKVNDAGAILVASTLPDADGLMGLLLSGVLGWPIVPGSVGCISFASSEKPSCGEYDVLTCAPLTSPAIRTRGVSVTA